LETKLVYESLNDIFKSKTEDEIINNLSKIPKDYLNNELIGWSSSSGNSEFLDSEINKLKLYLKAGADINYIRKDGLSPLTCAIFWDQLEIAEFLLKNGANPNLKNKNRKTPLDFILTKPLKEDRKIFIKLLKKYGLKDES